MDDERTAILTARKDLYERHAQERLRAAEVTDDLRLRERLLKMAHQWTEEAAVLKAPATRIQRSRRK
jgi:hypothetical protein